MKRAKGVEKGCVRDGWSPILSLQEGRVVFSEATPKGMLLRLDNHEGQMWIHRRVPAASVHVGRTLRGFYDGGRIGDKVVISAYELYDNSGNLLTRARKEGLRFVGESSEG